MTVTPCEATKIEYAGNGSRTKFQFPFSYMHFYDVKAALWDDHKKEYITQDNLYVLSDASTVEFLQAPPSPPEGTPNGLNVRIYRDTNLDNMESTFYPGSSIRAQDLNDDFDQIRFSVQETQCAVSSNKKDLEEQFWGKFGIGGRGDLATPESPYDTMYRADVIKGRWYGDTEGYEVDQDAVPTTGAVSARLDPFVQGSVPDKYSAESNGLVNVYNPSAGKRWVNTDDCWESYWDPGANAWVAFVNTGPRGPQGDAGVQGDQGIQGIQGIQGETGQGLVFKGQVSTSLNLPSEGNQVNDAWQALDTGNYWVWTGSVWVDVGPVVQGPPGIQGPVMDISLLPSLPA